MLHPIKLSFLPFQVSGRLIFFLLSGWLFCYPLATAHSVLLSENKQGKVERGQLPLLFEKNEGQADASVLYLTRGAGGTFYFRPHDILLVLKKEGEEKEREEEAVFFPIKMEFVGTSSCEARGEEERECKSHYFIGNNPTEWKTSLSNYAKLKYESIYPGIDFVFYGNAQQLGYDIVISPGARPETIQLRFEGIDELSVTPEGHLRLLISGGEELLMIKPLPYQMEENDLIHVDGQFMQLGSKEVGFALGDYDINRTLIIDPTLIYSTYLGSDPFAVDRDGNAYLIGGTNSTFPMTIEAFQPTLSSSVLQNAFISKVDSTGTSLIYSTYLGGDQSTIGNRVGLDSDGNAYLTGLTRASNFPTTANAFQASLDASFTPNAFITKVNAKGSELIYSSYLTETLENEGKDSVLEGDEDIYPQQQINSSPFSMLKELTESQKPVLSKTEEGLPIILRMTPNQGPSTGGTSVIITGANFETTTTVRFGEISANFTIDSETQITVLSPSGTGRTPITVITSLGNSCSSPMHFFTYIQAKQMTVTKLSVYPNPAKCEQDAFLTAEVTPPSVKGNISFFDGSTLTGIVPLVNGTAQMSLSDLSVGVHHLTAVYNSDMDHYASTSLSVALPIQPIDLPYELVLPPTDLKARQINKKFAMQKKLINILTWKAPTTGPHIEAYKIYRDPTLKKLVATILNQGPLRFKEHQRRKGKAPYFIISVDEFGNPSVPCQFK